MMNVLQDSPGELAHLQLVQNVLGAQPLRIVRQGLAESGKGVYRVYLMDGRSVVLRTSERRHTFAFTGNNLKVLAALGLPVQTVLSAGLTDDGGSHVILNWIPGRDLIHELGAMSHAQMTRLAELVVDCQRRLGRLPEAAQFGWAPIGRSGSLQKWTQVFGEAASASSLDDGTMLGKLRGQLCALRSRVESYFDSVRPTPFLDDLTTKNVLIENGNLSGIIDVDFICYGDPLLTVGSTIASIVADAPEAGLFYGDELIRCWNPNDEQRHAIRFYSALWAIGFLQTTDAAANPARSEALMFAAESWLADAE